MLSALIGVIIMLFVVLFFTSIIYIPFMLFKDHGIYQAVFVMISVTWGLFNWLLFKKI